MCVALMERRRESAHSSKIRCLLAQSPGTNAALAIYVRNPRTCCRCESVHAAIPVVPETPLALKRLLPIPSGLCAIGSEVPTTVPKLAFPRTPLPSRASMRLL